MKRIATRPFLVLFTALALFLPAFATNLRVLTAPYGTDVGAVECVLSVLWCLFAVLFPFLPRTCKWKHSDRLSCIYGVLLVIAPISLLLCAVIPDVQARKLLLYPILGVLSPFYGLQMIGKPFIEHPMAENNTDMLVCIAVGLFTIAVYAVRKIRSKI